MKKGARVQGEDSGASSERGAAGGSGHLARLVAASAAAAGRLRARVRIDI